MHVFVCYLLRNVGVGVGVGVGVKKTDLEYFLGVAWSQHDTPRHLILQLGTGNC